MKRLGESIRLPSRDPAAYVEMSAQRCPVCGLIECPCPQCHGCGQCVDRRWENGREQKLVTCPVCQGGVSAANRRETLVTRSGLDHAALSHTFTESAARESQRHAWSQALGFSREPDGWMAFEGPFGTGKTFLSHCIANAMLDKGMSVRFRLEMLLFNDLRATFNRTQTAYARNEGDGEAGYDAIFDSYLNAQLLVLDDIGAGKLTDWEDKQLFILIDHRWSKRLPTVFTLNPSIAKLSQRVRARMSDTNICRSVQVGP